MLGRWVGLGADALPCGSVESTPHEKQREHGRGDRGRVMEGATTTVSLTVTRTEHDTPSYEAGGLEAQPTTQQSAVEALIKQESSRSSRSKGRVDCRVEYCRNKLAKGRGDSSESIYWCLGVQSSISPQ